MVNIIFSEEGYSSSHHDDSEVFSDISSERSVTSRSVSSGDSLGDDCIFNGAYVIGDVHFRSKHLPEALEFIDKCVINAKGLFPSMIVLLGDILDTHEVARNVPYKLACELIEKLSAIAPVYVLIGNHDYINNSQFCSDNHFFNPLKKWKNVTIVDKPMVAVVEGKKFAFSPYVVNGRFIEALTTHLKNEWRECCVIFAHQEIHGVSLREGVTSVHGDRWRHDLPPLISGHIHDPQTVGTNVHYVGSAMQIHFDETPDKMNWLINFDDSPEKNLVIEKFNLGLKNKKEVKLDILEVNSFDFELIKKYNIKLTLKGTSEQFQHFKKSKQYSQLVKQGVKMCFNPVVTARETKFTSRVDLSFDTVFRDLVKAKNDEVLYKTYEMIEI